MDDISKLKRALFVLKKSIIECPIGAVSPDDYKPIEEKIRDLRVSLSCLNSRIRRLQAQTSLHSVPNPPEEKRPELLNQYQNQLSSCVINNHMMSAIHHSNTVQEIFDNDKIDPDIQRKTKVAMTKLFNLNDVALSIHHELNEICLSKELELKDKWAQTITEFSEFLHQQEKIRHEKLAKSNPEAVAKKEKILKLIQKINTMKRLITNFISTSSKTIKDNPEFIELLKKHRDLISLETIIIMSQNKC
ncbi:uncharacterized protein [Chelonus insularis]|uniref:uncharacterized protein n=1 Tax=Chelonus insularis TaxID=460826 RepID=UPI00158C8BFF|nr:uncharacterized protein LOC118063840 [Chelonus insularis]XP_034933912.1 uncharacterized protein LOC118063840 [Chelonus insularis]